VLKRSDLEIGQFFDFLREFIVLEWMRSEHVVRAYTFQTTATHFEYTMDCAPLVLELVSIPASTRMQTALHYGKQIALGVFELHSRARVLHMDVRPTNILVFSPNCAKVADLTLTAPLRPNELHAHPTTCESSRGAFRAPECPRHDDTSNNTNTNNESESSLYEMWSPSVASDIWSVGMIIFWIASSRAIPSQMQWNSEVTAEQIARLPFLLDKQSALYESVSHLIRGLCSTCPSERIKCMEQFIEKEYEPSTQRTWIQNIFGAQDSTNEKVELDERLCHNEALFEKHCALICENTQIECKSVMEECVAWYNELFGHRRHECVENEAILTSEQKGRLQFIINVHSSVRCVMSYRDPCPASNEGACKTLQSCLNREQCGRWSISSVRESLFRIQ